jgi:hypothetical protein
MFSFSFSQKINIDAMSLSIPLQQGHLTILLVDLLKYNDVQHQKHDLHNKK